MDLTHPVYSFRIDRKRIQGFQYTWHRGHGKTWQPQTALPASGLSTSPTTQTISTIKMADLPFSPGSSVTVWQWQTPLVISQSSMPRARLLTCRSLTMTLESSYEDNLVMTALTHNAGTTEPHFAMNAGLNDAWYNPITDGQGFFITVFPELGKVSLAWFTYDTSLPPVDASADLGSPGHRWLTALGDIDGDTAVLDITIASGGLFDTATEVQPVQSTNDGTITLSFSDCNSGMIDYDIPSIGRQGSVPIERVANDNAALCEALLGE